MLVNAEGVGWRTDRAILWRELNLVGVPLPRSPIVSVAGDDGFLVLTEIRTLATEGLDLSESRHLARVHHIPLVQIVFMIKRLQLHFYHLVRALSWTETNISPLKMRGCSTNLCTSHSEL